MLRKIITAGILLIAVFSLTACASVPGRAKGDKGDNGLSAFEVYKNYHPGYEGDEAKWIEDVLKGDNGAGGLSAFEIYKQHHPEYEGSEGQWIDDVLKGKNGAGGLSAFKIYQKYFFYEGTEEDWIDDLINGRLKDVAHGTPVLRPLSEGMEEVIKPQFIQYFNDTAVWSYLTYLGVYNGAFVFFSPAGSATLTTKVIAGVTFSSGNDFRIRVWKDGQFWNIEEAYLIGILNPEDIKTIRYYYGIRP